MTKLPKLPRVWCSTSLRRQIIVLTAIATAVGIILLTVLTQVLLARNTAASLDSVLQSRTDTLVRSLTIGTDGKVIVPDRSVGSGMVVYVNGEQIAGIPPGELADRYTDQGEARSTSTTEYQRAWRIRAEPFHVGAASGVVVSSEALAPYERAERLALVVSIVAGILMVGLAAAVAALVTRRALAPVDDMALTARQWSERDLGSRFTTAAPRNEFSALAETLNLLLDRVAEAIRSEQRLTSELAHELRTPLTAIRGSTDLLLMKDSLSAEDREDLEAIHEGATRMSLTITELLDLARAETDGITPSAGSIRALDVVDEVLSELGAPDSVSVTIPEHVTIRAPQALAQRALAPVVANALRMGDAVTIGVKDSSNDHVDIVVSDSGPGVDPSLRPHIFEPGVTSGKGSGAGLGLPLARRIALSIGGDVVLDRAAAPTTFVVRLPR